MPSFYVSPEDVTEDSIRIVGDEANHAIRVAHHRVGDTICAIDGLGGWYRVTVTGTNGGELSGLIVERRRNAGERSSTLILAQALVKRGRFDLTVEKCTELGAAVILPMVTERTVVEADSPQRLLRWQRIGKAAAKQCGRSVFPEIREPAELASILSEYADQCGIVAAAYEQEHEVRLGDIARQASRTPGRSACILIGPEGGLTDTEVGRVREAGGLTFTLGPGILRTETAAIAATSIFFEYS